MWSGPPISSSLWFLFRFSRKPGVSPFSSYSIEAPIKASRRALRLFIQPIASCRPDVDKEVNEVFHLYIATISVFLSEKLPLPSVLRLHCIPRKLLLPQERVRIIRLCRTSPQGSRSQVDQLLVHISWQKNIPSLNLKISHPEVLAETWLYAFWSFFSRFSKRPPAAARLSLIPIFNY